MKALAVLLRYNEMDAGFLGSTIQTLCNQLHYGPHMEDEVALGLANVLYRVPALLDQFCERSLKFDSFQKQESVLNLRALVSNFTADVQTWQATCPLAKMACLAIFHLATNTSKEALRYAIELANFLVGEKVGAICPAYKTGQLIVQWPTKAASAPTASDLSQLYHAKRFSSALAARVPLETNQFLESTSKWIEVLSDPYKRSILSLLPSWVKNFEQVASSPKGAGSSDSPGSTFLEHLLTITKKCQSAVLSDVIETVWQEAVRTPSTVAIVVDFLVRAAATGDKKTYDVCALVLVFVSRTSAVEAVLKQLFSVVR
jgi:hypothetical protein